MSDPKLEQMARDYNCEWWHVDAPMLREANEALSALLEQARREGAEEEQGSLYAGLCKAVIARILSGPEKWCDEPNDILLRLESYIWRAEQAEAAEARVKELEAKLNEERACHDCREYRAMMEAKLAAAQDFVRYEVVRQGTGKHSVYGFRPEGVRVKLDELFLKDHDRDLAAERAAHERTRERVRKLPDDIEAEAREVPLGAAFHGGPLDDAPIFDVMMWAVRRLRGGGE